MGRYTNEYKRVIGFKSDSQADTAKKKIQQRSKLKVERIGGLLYFSSSVAKAKALRILNR